MLNVVDLHMHSFYSDGEFNPEWLVTLAQKAGVQLISLTDHDEIAGTAAYAKSRRAGRYSFCDGR